MGFDEPGDSTGNIAHHRVLAQGAGARPEVVIAFGIITFAYSSIIVMHIIFCYRVYNTATLPWLLCSVSAEGRILFWSLENKAIHSSFSV